VEFILRVLTCPNRIRFVLDWFNWVDLLAILPYYISMIFSEEAQSGGFGVIRSIRLVRLARIFKVSRYVSGLRIFVQALLYSSSQLSMLTLVILMLMVILGSAVYFCEFSADGCRYNPWTKETGWVRISSDAFPLAPLTPLNGSIRSSVAATGTSLIPTVAHSCMFPPEQYDSSLVDVHSRQHLPLVHERKYCTRQCAPPYSKSRLVVTFEDYGNSGVPLIVKRLFLVKPKGGKAESRFELDRCRCDDPNPFISIPHSFWWCIVTLTSVGYGEQVPYTWSGKIVASAAMVLGIMIMALPVSVIGTNFQAVFVQFRKDFVVNELDKFALDGKLEKREIQSLLSHLQDLQIPLKSVKDVLNTYDAKSKGFMNIEEIQLFRDDVIAGASKLNQEQEIKQAGIFSGNNLTSMEKDEMAALADVPKDFDKLIEHRLKNARRRFENKLQCIGEFAVILNSQLEDRQVSQIRALQRAAQGKPPKNVVTFRE